MSERWIKVPVGLARQGRGAKGVPRGYATPSLPARLVVSRISPMQSGTLRRSLLVFC
jgi:hypothetical protein